MTERLPARLDRRAIDRVLHRATEIQAHRRDLGEGLSEDDVLALGVEVGIPESHLRQALIEERTRYAAPESEGALDRWIAPGTVSAARVVQGTQESIGAALRLWLDRHEVLVVQRNTKGLITWEQAGSFAAAMRRVGWALSAKGTRPFLDRARTVTAVLTPLEADFCHVTLVAELRGVRTGYLAGGASLAGGLTLAAGLATILGAPALLMAAAIPAAGIGWLVTGLYRPVAHRTRLGLERALDHLEERPQVPTPIAPPKRTSSLAEGVGAVVRDITTEVRKAIGEQKK
jgi:hypothetical protein